MKYLLLDANVLVAAYCKDENSLTRRRAQWLLAFGLEGEAFFYVPNFCIAEVLKAFARKCWEEKLFGEPRAAYLGLRDPFLSRLEESSDAKLYSYGLTERHIRLSEELNETAATISYRNGQFPSAFDLLLLGMGRDLARVHGEDFAIVTAERPITDIAAKDRSLPEVLNISEREIPRRWFDA